MFRYSTILFLSICSVFAYLPSKFFRDPIVGEGFIKKSIESTNSTVIEEGSGEEPIDTTVTVVNVTTEYITTTIHTPIQCYDQSKKCASIKTLCTSGPYRDIMVKQCAKTCGVCDKFLRLPAAERCSDHYHSCPEWARNGFCHSTYYTLDERQESCRKSCGACA